MVAVIPLFFDKTRELPTGLIHVGAHYGQEIPHYKKWGIENIVAYEPLNDAFDKLILNFGVDCRQKAVGNTNGEIEINVETVNHGQSSSVLKPKKHLEQYPEIIFDKTVKVPIVKLDDDIEDHSKYQILVVDVQGYELEVFKGARELLDSIEVIVCEVNCEEVYENCARVNEIDEFLSGLGFRRILTTWEGGNWGNAAYFKL